MPELPDVETVARLLRQTVVGHRIARVRVLTAATVRSPAPATFARQLRGRQIRAIDRRGKYLLIRLAGGHVLIAHLRMTGDFVVVPRAAPIHPHTRVVFEVGKRDLRFIDQRRFGHMDLVPTVDTFAPLRRVGVEPLGRAFTLVRWQQLVTARRVTSKGLLLRQDLVAGIGNIYADEILWQARIHPARPTHRLRPEEIRRLYRTIRRVLRRAVRDLSRYGRPIGRFLEVRGEHDVPCPRCRRAIRTARIAGRTSYFCASCQR